MWKTRTFWLQFAVVMLSFFNMPFVAAAETASPNAVAVSLVIDTSGSMSETDAENLRQTAADIFIDLLNPEDYVGIVTFSTAATEAVPMQQVAAADQKEKLKTAYDGKLEAEGSTDYLAALKLAEAQLDNIKNSSIQKRIIFITDGKPEPALEKNGKTDLSTYMETLYTKVADLGAKGYTVYAMGFGTADSAVLDRISQTTAGATVLLSRPDEIAVNLFQTLNEWKNRSTFLAETVEINGEKSLPLVLDGYTSQLTLVIVPAEKAELSVRVADKEEKESASAAVQNFSGYSIVTLNPSQAEQMQEADLLLQIDGKVQLLGSQDPVLKADLLEPQANIQHPLGEPLTVAVQIEGNLPADGTAEVLLTKNGTAEASAHPMEEKDGLYTFTYDAVDEAGDYLIEVRIKEGEKTISTAHTTIKVRDLPVLEISLDNEDTVYTQGEEQTITAYLTKKGNRMESSSDLTITSFDFVETEEDGTQTLTPLQDNGEMTNFDILFGDGIFSGHILHQSEGSKEAMVVVQGSYKGEAFILKKEVEAYEVVAGGFLAVSPLTADATGSAGKRIVYPVEVKNTSKQEETFTLTMDETAGTLRKQQFTVPANTTVTKKIGIDLNEDLAPGDYQLTVELEGGNAAALQADELQLRVSVVSFLDFYLSQAALFWDQNYLMIVTVLSTAILLYGGGMALYHRNRWQNFFCQATLAYKKTGEEDHAFHYWRLPRKKEVFTIGFGTGDAEADFCLPAAADTFRLTVVLEKPETESKKWLTGYRLFVKGEKEQPLRLTASPPGIIKVNGMFYSSYQVQKGQSFEAGGYLFIVGRKELQKTRPERARDLLEGKM